MEEKKVFQVGDRVIAIDYCDHADIAGYEGTVVYVRSGGYLPIGVEFDRKYGTFHELAVDTDDGIKMMSPSKRGWWCPVSGLALIDDLEDFECLPQVDMLLA